MMVIIPGVQHESELLEQGYAYIAGVDEAGRGAWAGPLFAAAVILPLDDPDLAQRLDGVRDSKTLTPHRRDVLYDTVIEVALAYGVGNASQVEIDRYGVVPATRRAMIRALAHLSIEPDALLIDYVKLPESDLPQRNLTRGEDQSLSIAAASILAKVSRDRLMIEQAESFPDYGFARHKGYGTLQHHYALAELGPCPLHRRSFAPIRRRLEKA
jgi:ribonuclease HII